MSFVSRLAVAPLALAAVLLACSFGAARAPEVARRAEPSSQRPTEAGDVVGFADERGAHVWLGIAFAKPPVGELRWRAPQPPVRESGVREALAAGSPCPQFAGPLGDPDAEPGTVIGAEDCLYLNVFAPRFADGQAPAEGARLPVMFWIHGGGNVIGHGGSYDGSALALEQNVVVVTANYRLGALGWFRHPALAAGSQDPRDRSGNFGTLDLIRGLEWVRDNIAAFGGDPQNVTIFGESAGGHDVFTLLVSPGAKGLFHRAISQSGGTDLDGVTEAEQYSDADPPGDAFSSREVVLRLLQQENGATESRESLKARAESMPAPEIARMLRARSAADLLAVFGPVGPFGMYRSPRVFRDGHVIPDREMPELLASGRYHRVPVMLGTNRDETKLFMAGDPRLVQRVLWVLPRVRDPRGYDLAAEYQSSLWKASGVDEPAAAMVASGNRRVFAYRFDWDEQGRRLWVTDLSRLIGAGHGVEIPFVFDDFEGPAFGRLFDESSEEGRVALGRAMRAYWAEFARTGDPGRGGRDLPRWTAWSSEPAGEKFAVLDTQAGGGIRMSSAAVTRAGLIDAIASDARFRDQQERCALLANMVRFENLTPEEYGSRGCADHPLPDEDVAAR
jgi:para-nitrobenzyl esterase